jgi:hypothetical protein
MILGKVYCDNAGNLVDDDRRRIDRLAAFKPSHGIERIVWNDEDFERATLDRSVVGPRAEANRTSVTSPYLLFGPLNRLVR